MPRQAVDLPPPGGDGGAVHWRRIGLPGRQQRRQRAAGIGDDGQLDRHVLVDAGRVDVDVDFPALGAEGVEPAGDAVVEAGADVQQHVAAVHGQVGLVSAVHAQHAEELRVAGREGAQPHQRVGAGKSGGADEAGERRGGGRPGVDHATAGIDHRAFRRFQHRHGAADQGAVRLGLRAVGAVRGFRRRGVRGAADQDVLGQVDHHRPGPAAARHVERLMHHAGEVARALDQVIVLGGRAGDAGGVGFLEGVVADQMGGHLAGQADHRDAVHQRVGQAGDGVGGARPAGHQHHADAAGAAGIALGGMHGGLLVPHQDVADRVLVEQRVVDRQHRPARIAENDLDPLVLERTQEYLRAGGGGGFGTGRWLCCICHDSAPLIRPRRRVNSSGE